MFGNAVVAGQDMLMLTQSEVAFGGLGNPLGKLEPFGGIIEMRCSH
jgi:hypothetical protein